ncbi:MAG TPA: Gfo/Idh/MocA family oxidoreductase [Ramlibacter sp.]|nr:Gfo/Idh/MocA family oxidoreductase [Ramlibacter sp.]
MKALVIGLGSMGRRRIRCLQRHGIAHIAAHDLRADRRDAAAAEYGVHALAHLSAQDVSGYDLVVVSTPPDQHHLHLGWAIAAGRPVFVEASVIRAPLPALAKKAREAGVLVAPSCTLRFHPAIREITQLVKSGRYGKVCNFSYHCGQYLPDWHPWERVTDYYVSQPETGGAREIVPFELTWMVDAFGWPRVAGGMRLATTDVGAPIDDTYAALLRFDGAQGTPGFAGALVVDVVARDAVRRLTLNLERASVAWDWNDGVVRVWDADAGSRLELRQADAAAHEGYNPNIGEQMYLDEIGAFIAAAAGSAAFPHTLEDDMRVLELLEAIEAFHDRPH